MLCAMDPRLTNVPGATLQSPGRQFPFEKYKRYSGVFDAPYLMDKLDPDVGVLFRLPLRTWEQVAEKERRISATIHDKKAVQRLLEDFMDEDASECLLFLKNVRKVRASVVNDEGNLVEIGKSEAKMDGPAEAQLKGLRDYLVVATNSLGIGGVEPASISYKLQVESILRGRKNKQLWSIVQQVGFKDKGNSLSEELRDNIDRKVIGRYIVVQAYLSFQFRY